MTEKTIPYIVCLFCIGCAIGYALVGQWAKVLYWVSAIFITLSVVMM